MNKSIINIGVVVFLAIILSGNGSLIFAEHEATLGYVEAMNGGQIEQEPLGTRSNNWHIETLDEFDGSPNEGISLKFDSNDRPHIAYSDTHINNLKYAFFNGARWVIETVDSYGRTGIDPSIAIDSNDLPHVSYGYRKEPNYHLKYAYYDGNSWNTQTIDSSPKGNVVDISTSIALDSNDHVHISYFDDTNDNLTYAYYDGNSWHIEVVDSDMCGEFSSIDVDSFNRPHISYSGSGPTSWILKYAYYAGGSWHIETVNEMDRVGTSLVIDDNDRAHISYVNDSSLIYAHYNGAWEFTEVESSPMKVNCPSISLDSKNLPHISYFDDFCGALKYASYDGFSWSRETVVMRNTYSNSICLDSNDEINICYRYHGLEYAVMDNVLPISTIINPDSNFQRTTPFSIDVNASDNSHQGLKDIALWYRYSTDNSSWSEWRFYSIDGSVPWSFTFDTTEGDGYYQFYSVANDTAGNHEESPTSSDASVIYDTQRPISSVEDIPKYWQKTIPVSMDVDASDDLSGMKSLELWYRFSMDNITWGDWICFGTKAWPSYSFNFTPLNVGGYYQFYTIAKDEAGNRESIPPTKDAVCGLNITSFKTSEYYTYKNITYQNGTFYNITHKNTTYKNYTNQSGSVLYQNTTNGLVNYTYLNETLLQHNKQLEDKLKLVMDQLNETDHSSEGEKGIESQNDTYSELFTIVLLVIIAGLLVLILLMRRKKKEPIEHTKELNKPVGISVSVQGNALQTRPQLQTKYQQPSVQQSPPPVSPPSTLYQQLPSTPIQNTPLLPPMPQVPTLKPAPASVQSIIPGYTLTHKIGAGGFATVYKGRDAKGSTVAIKLPKIMDSTVDISVLEKFRAESDIWKKLKHENIVNFLKGDIRPVPYMVIEYMEGGNLLELMKAGPLPSDRAISIIKQVLSGMAYAHRMASVHRDIKPENILFTRDGTAKISDWGIGKFMASESVSKTIGGKGTLAYSSPEQVSKDKFGEVDWSTDIFQLGIVCYEMLTGENPFYSEDSVGIVNNIVNKIPLPPSTFNREIPVELDRIILRALEKEKEKRWSSAEVMYDRMKEFIRE